MTDRAQDRLLDLHSVGIRFGGLSAVSDVDFTLRRGELAGLIGPNGAGKTTLFNLMTGIYTPTSGHIRIAGVPTAGLKPFQICSLGVARTFQNIRLFGKMSVEDNVRVACTRQLHSRAWGALMRGATFRREEAEIRERVRQLLDLFGLSAHMTTQAGSLPYGAQRRLEIVRALATRPQLLLLDEPAAGMNPTEKQDLMRLINEIRSQFSLTILLVEHSMRVVMGLCERILVLDQGRRIAEGTPEMVRRNPAVIEAYLGDGAAGHH